ncbi:tRNA-dihydrouridine synthase 1 [Sporothrix brasiliensis 5110]|uniref:tRNA-dihydrouridine(16/17) synthase [NAD(P)(+)] n=1 Tax=Sporothrix brasiliensis 5110 TaxID=1398154 RepID=A0A0C2IT48_9PEZI|nr:tRNA-dihydrouridine synthase 1 [Sporothrix brasiliensis 5110]KIH92221.1 tRNA-dihydrouridine synthase 1 [Sporothrix brasiliensis 5110]
MSPTEAAVPTATAVPPVAEASNGLSKKLHGRAFYESIGSPKHIVAPMVDQSEFHFEAIKEDSGERGETTSTPKETGEQQNGGDSANGTGVGTDNGLRPFLDGNPAIDRPLFVQFCANDADALLSAARRVAPYCDAVDLNLGCPQGIARKGHYGAFLQEEPELIAKLIRTLHENLDVPVTAKIRLLDTPEASLQYARTVLAAGASILTVHGRRREQKGHMTGIADWTMLRYLRENLPKETVLFANGNVLEHGDVERCLAATGFDGVMSAEGLLSNPGLFSPPPPPSVSAPEPESSAPAVADPEYYWHTPDPRREYWTSSRPGSRRGGWRIDAVMRRYLDILHVYCLGEAAPPARKPLFIVGDPVEWLKEEEPGQSKSSGAGGKGADSGEPARKKRKQDNHTNGNGNGSATPAQPIPKEIFNSPNFVAVQAHLFHLLRHAVGKHHDIRDRLARTRKADMAGYERILVMLEKRVGQALLAGEDKAFEAEYEAGADTEVEPEIVDDPNSSAAAIRRCKRPWWVVQPILRPMPAEALAKGAIQLKKKAKAELEKETKEADKNDDTTKEAEAAVVV